MPDQDNCLNLLSQLFIFNSLKEMCHPQKRITVRTTEITYGRHWCRTIVKLQWSL